jgi:hypothetical protein
MNCILHLQTEQLPLNPPSKFPNQGVLAFPGAPCFLKLTGVYHNIDKTAIFIYNNAFDKKEA